jgi:hypothetical protein
MAEHRNPSWTGAGRLVQVALDDPASLLRACLDIRLEGAAQRCHRHRLPSGWARMVEPATRSSAPAFQARGAVATSVSETMCGTSIGGLVSRSCCRSQTAAETQA